MLEDEILELAEPVRGRMPRVTGLSFHIGQDDDDSGFLKLNIGQCRKGKHGIEIVLSMMISVLLCAEWTDPSTMTSAVQVITTSIKADLQGHESLPGPLRVQMAFSPRC